MKALRWTSFCKSAFLALATWLLFSAVPDRLWAIPVPCFTMLTDTVGCVPFTARINSCATGQASPLDVVYQDKELVPRVFNPTSPTLPGSTTDFVYNQPGIYFLTQSITYDSTISPGTTVRRTVSFSRRIIVLESLLPVFTLIPCNNLQVKILINKRPGERFRIDYGNGASFVTTSSETSLYDTSYTYPSGTVPLQNITVTDLYCNRVNAQQIVLQRELPAPTRITLRINGNVANFVATTPAQWQYRVSRRLANGSFLPIDVAQPTRNTFLAVVDPGADTVFRIDASDPCGNPVLYGPQDMVYYSGTAVAENGVNRVTWDTILLPGNPFARTHRTQIRRNNRLIGDTNNVNSPFLDGDANCGLFYCYEVVAITQQQRALPTPEMVAIGKPSCVGSINVNQPPAPTNVLVSVSDPVVDISFTKPENASDTILMNRSEGTGSMTAYRTTFTTFTTDRVVKVDNFQYCYNLFYFDACGNISDTSASVCSVLLTANPTEPGRLNRRTLNWNLYNGFAPGSFGQTVQRINNDLQVQDSVVLDGNTTTYIDEAPFGEGRLMRYRIRTWRNDGVSQQSYSNIAEISYPDRPIFPRAFSPNGDGLNDRLLPTYSPITEFSVDIYDRVGNLVYSSTNPTEGWDGTLRGRPCPSGAYVYLVKGRDDTGTWLGTKDVIMLVR